MNIFVYYIMVSSDLYFECHICCYVPFMYDTSFGSLYPKHNYVVDISYAECWDDT
jgi:hypothetical protein